MEIKNYTGNIVFTDNSDRIKDTLVAAIKARADLYKANLSGANLYRANLSEANLSGADLSGANLSGADLYRANLYRTILYRADLSGANLSGADLSEADLSEADLSGAKNINIPINCPEVGSFTAFKKCQGNRIVELLIPSDAKRSSATSRKCRANKAVVVSIKTIKNIPYKQAISYHDNSFIYKVGETVEVKDFCENRFQECATGIHFFITRQEAINY